MTPEERSTLERVAKLVEENNSLLRSIRRANRVSIVMRVLYWAVIIGLSFGAFYVVQPYVRSLTDAYTQIQGTASSVKGASDTFQDLFR